MDIRALKRTVETALKECGEAEAVRQFEALERSHRIDALDLFSRSTDRLSRQNRIRELVGKSRERPNISALARAIRRRPPHHHPRPPGIDPPRPAQTRSLSGVGKSAGGRLEQFQKFATPPASSGKPAGLPYRSGNFFR